MASAWVTLQLHRWSSSRQEIASESWLKLCLLRPRTPLRFNCVPIIAVQTYGRYLLHFRPGRADPIGKWQPSLVIATVWTRKETVWGEGRGSWRRWGRGEFNKPIRSCLLSSLSIIVNTQAVKWRVCLCHANRGWRTICVSPANIWKSFFKIVQLRKLNNYAV